MKQKLSFRKLSILTIVLASSVPIGCAQQHWYMERVTDFDVTTTQVVAGPFKSERECADARKVYESYNTSLSYEYSCVQKQ